MERFQLIVKGDSETVVLVAQRYVTRILTIAPSFGGEIQVMDVEAPRGNIIDWFRQDIGAPHPPGTLMHYQERE